MTYGFLNIKSNVPECEIVGTFLLWQYFYEQFSDHFINFGGEKLKMSVNLMLLVLTEEWRSCSDK